MSLAQDMLRIAAEKDFQRSVKRQNYQRALVKNVYYRQKMTSGSKQWEVVFVRSKKVVYQRYWETMEEATADADRMRPIINEQYPTPKKRNHQP